MVLSVFHAESRVMPQLVARLWMSRFCLCYLDGGGINSRGFCYDLTPGGDGAPSHGKRRLILGEGFATRISGNVRPQDPGGKTPTIAAPQRMMDVDVSDTPELFGGGGSQSVPSRISVVLVEEATVGGTPRLGCPCDDQRERQPARGTVRENSLGSPCVGGTLSHYGITGLDVANAPALSDGGLSRFPHGFRWGWSMRPMLGALHDGSVHVMIRIYGRWLAWRSRLV